MSKKTRRVLMVAVTAALFASPVLTTPAKACSCAMPGDIAAWVDDSEAAFVGTMVERRDGGFSNDFGDMSIYVFEVEQWVKGDAGDVIEVHSASNGAACGFEFWNDDNRTGAILHEEDGRLHGSLCAQIDPDVLLAAMSSPTPSVTGIPAFLVAKGWNSTGLDVVDVSGGYISTLWPPGDDVEFDGTRTIDVCPNGHLAVQQTNTGVHVWDLSELEITTSHSLVGDPNTTWIESISCRDPEAGSIYAVIGGEFSRELIDLVSGDAIANVPGWVMSFGDHYLVVQTEADNEQLMLLDLETGDVSPIVEVPPNEIRGTYVDIHPTEPLLALLEVFYGGNNREPNSRLSIMGVDGVVETEVDIPGESQGPMWIDDNRVYVQSLDWDGAEPPSGVVIDINTGESLTLEAFSVWEFATDGTIALGANGGQILRANLTTGEVETVTVLPSQQAGPVVLLPQFEEPLPVVTEDPIPAPPPTTPPLVLEPTAIETGTSSTRLIAGITVGIAVLGFVWLAISSRPNSGATRLGESDEVE